MMVPFSVGRSATLDRLMLGPDEARVTSADRPAYLRDTCEIGTLTEKVNADRSISLGQGLRPMGEEEDQINRTDFLSVAPRHSRAEAALAAVACAP